jgi:hypothetical protein
MPTLTPTLGRMPPIWTTRSDFLDFFVWFWCKFNCLVGAMRDWFCVMGWGARAQRPRAAKGVQKKIKLGCPGSQIDS